MRFVLSIECDNDAFHLTTATEIGRILRATAQRVEANGDGFRDPAKILDSNGNTVGSFVLSDDSQRFGIAPGRCITVDGRPAVYLQIVQGTDRDGATNARAVSPATADSFARQIVDCLNAAPGINVDTPRVVRAASK